MIELWQLKNWATRTGGKFKKLYDERESMFAQVRDNLAHLKRLSHAVLGRGSAANTAEPAATVEEAVRLSELFGVRVFPQLTLGKRSPCYTARDFPLFERAS